MVHFTHQRASHISKTNFVTCLVFKIHTDTNTLFIFSLRDLFELVSSSANSSVSAMLVKWNQNYVTSEWRATLYT